MVRVAGLKQQLAPSEAARAAAPDGMLAAASSSQLVSRRAHRMVADQYRLWRERAAARARARHGIRIVRPPRAHARAGGRGAGAASTSASSRCSRRSRWIRGHPFPHLRNKSINAGGACCPARRAASAGAAAERAGGGGRCTARCSGSSRSAPAGTFMLARGPHRASTSGELFPGKTELRTAAFRVTRNWDLDSTRRSPRSCSRTIQDELRRRDRGRGGAARAGRPARRRSSLAAPGRASSSSTRRTSTGRGAAAAAGPRGAGRPDRPELPRASRFARRVPPALRDESSIFAAIARAGLAAPPPLRVLRPGGPLHRGGGRGPERPGHQADALPHRQATAPSSARCSARPRTASRWRRCSSRSRPAWTRTEQHRLGARSRTPARASSTATTA